MGAVERPRLGARTVQSPHPTERGPLFSEQDLGFARH